MKNFLKNNWFKISLLIIILMVIIGIFYWFQLRSSQIRKECIEKFPRAFSKSTSILAGSQEAEYKACLTEHGLEK